MIERSIAVETHGRYLVEPPAGDGPAPLLVGFHGYSESADVQLGRLRAIPASAGWRLVSVQGLHRFYQRRSDEVVASWMTRQQRELAIADNLLYVAAVIDDVAREWPTTQPLVLAGFSQGVAMAFRAAASSARPVSAVIAVGGDVPPELDSAALTRIPSALVCHGASDPVYAPATFENDVRRLREAGVHVRPLDFDGGHEWAAAVIDAASRLLEELRA
jgi:predicted esterase